MDFFITEVVSGKLIQVRQINMFLLVKLGLFIGDEAEKMMFLFSELVYIDNEKQTPDQIKEISNIDIMTFISDAVNVQLQKLEYGKRT